MKKAHLLSRSLMLLLLFVGMSVDVFAQVTVTINASSGNLKTGSVNSSGTKNSGNMLNIRTLSSGSRGWAVFDLSSIPAGAIVTSAKVKFRTFNTTTSGATNRIRGVNGNPVTMSGTTLFSLLNTGTVLNASSWPGNAANTETVTSAGLTYLENNIGGDVLLGFVRGSTNQYNIYGNTASAANIPKLEITYLTLCTGTPTAGNIISPTNVCPNKGFKISLSGHTVASGVTYQWQSKPSSGGAFTNIAGATATSYNASINTPTDFRCIVSCGNSGQSATTASVSVTVNSFYVCYCNDNLGGNNNVPINNVTVVGTSLNNTSTGTASGFYTQYPPTGSTTASLQKGGMYEIAVAYGASAEGAVWIDANQNGVYESSEWTRINTSGTSGTAFVQVPANAVLGLTGMRVRSAAAGNSLGAGNACSNRSSGETEDYIINITPAPANDVRVLTLLNPSNDIAICPYIDIPVRAIIYNNGTNPQTNFDIYAVLTGAGANTINITYPGTLAPFTSDTLLLTTYNMQLVSNHTVQAYTVLSNDQDVANDSSKTHAFNIKFSASAPFVSDDSVCFGETAVLPLFGDTLEHKWYDNATGGSVVFKGDTMSLPNLQTNRTFYVTSQEVTYNSGSLATTTATGNGCGGGTMFNVIPNSNMTLDSFAAIFGSTGNQSVSVYYKNGTFSGSETNSGAWTLLGSTTVNVSSTTAQTGFSVNTPLVLQAGNTYGIYVNYNARYTNGTTTFSNADMSIQTGTGLCSQFGGTNNGRMFNGTLFYSSGAIGCESPRVPIKAHVGPKPVVNLGPDLKVCADKKIVLDAGNSGALYKWSTGEKTQTIDVTGKAGVYTVEVDQYCIENDTVTIQLDPLPSLDGISFVKFGNEYQYKTANLQHTDRVLWLFGDGNTSTSLSPKHIYATDGAYTVTLIAYNQCGTDTTRLVIPLDVKNVVVDKGVKIYPNPAKNNVVIELTDGISINEINIVNVLGASVYKQGITNSNKINIDISNMPVGNYIVRMNTDDGVINKQLIIVR
ncbi:MAG: GEVED domain-containing protein [Flavipsychrobacter sp.]